MLKQLFTLIAILATLTMTGFSQDRDIQSRDRGRDYQRQNRERQQDRDDNKVYGRDHRDDVNGVNKKRHRKKKRKWLPEVDLNVRISFPGKHRGRRGKHRRPTRYRYVNMPYLNDQPMGKSEFVLLAAEDIVLHAPEYMEGDIFANQDVHLNTGAPSNYYGRIFAGDDVEIRRRNAIEGVVLAGGDIDNYGHIEGHYRENRRMRPLHIPRLYPYRAGRESFTIRRSGYKHLSPGRYRNVYLRNGGILHLSSGVYYFNRLELGSETEIQFDTKRGPVIINVVENLKFGRNTSITSIQGEQSSDQIYFNSLQGRELQIGRNSNIMGTILAPYAAVHGFNNIQFKGVICARNIRFNRGATLLNHYAADDYFGYCDF